MKQRVITAIVLAAVFIPTVYYGTWVLDVLIALLAITGLYELYRMKDLDLFSVEGLISVLALLGMIFPNYVLQLFPEQFSSDTLIHLAALLLLICTVFTRNHFSFNEAGFSILGVLYIGFGFNSLLVTRETGLDLMVLVLITIWATDIFAYLFGRKIGKNKLAPKISPNKTIEGAVAGTASAVVLSGLYLYFFPLAMPYFQTIVFMGLLSVAGQLGDLVESAFKRTYEIKDSGKIFPGHGGVLDRFDSILFVFPLLNIFGLI